MGPEVGETFVGSSLDGIIVEPVDDHSALLDAVAGAKTSIHVEMYIWTHDLLVDALVAAKRAGREVKVLLEKSPYPTPTQNQAAFDALRAGGVDVRWTAGLFPLTHTKLLIVDASAAYVMTLNFSNAAFASNREYAAVDTQPDDVAEAETIFAADFAGTRISPSGKLVVSPVNSRNSLAGLIDSARASLDIEVEELSDPDMVSRIGAKARQGVRVRVILPSPPSKATAPSVAGLASAGVQVRGLANPYVHAKAIVVDGSVLYVGSVNLSSASLDRNREIGVISGTPAAVSRVVKTLDADFAAAGALN